MQLAQNYDVTFSVKLGRHLKNPELQRKCYEINEV